jgi:hypothetical protein
MRILQASKRFDRKVNVWEWLNVRGFDEWVIVYVAPNYFAAMKYINPNWEPQPQNDSGAQPGQRKRRQGGGRFQNKPAKSLGNSENSGKDYVPGENAPRT